MRCTDCNRAWEHSEEDNDKCPFCALNVLSSKMDKLKKTIAVSLCSGCNSLNIPELLMLLKLDVKVD